MPTELESVAHAHLPEPPTDASPAFRTALAVLVALSVLFVLAELGSVGLPVAIAIAAVAGFACHRLATWLLSIAITALGLALAVAALAGAFLR